MAKLIPITSIIPYLILVNIWNQVNKEILKRSCNGLEIQIPQMVTAGCRHQSQLSFGGAEHHFFVVFNLALKNSALQEMCSCTKTIAVEKKSTVSTSKNFSSSLQKSCHFVQKLNKALTQLLANSPFYLSLASGRLATSHFWKAKCSNHRIGLHAFLKTFAAAERQSPLKEIQTFRNSEEAT